MKLRAPVRAVCFDWGGTLMSEQGPDDRPMALWPEVAVISGATECLEALRGRAPLCIATNATVSHRDMIERALERVSLREHFSEIFCFTELGVRKDQPEFWKIVRERLGVPPDRIVMVGDSLEQDVLAPLRFGLQAVWFNERAAQPRPAAPVLTVTRLEEFVALVEDAL